MSDTIEDDDQHETRALEIIRARIHKLNDMVQTHEGRFVEHKTLILGLQSQVDSIRKLTATREQVEAIAVLHKTQLDGAVTTLSQSINNLKDQLEPIRRGMYWGVTLVLGAFILALVNLLIHGQK